MSAYLLLSQNSVKMNLVLIFKKLLLYYYGVETL